MKILLRAIALVHGLVALLFAGAGIGLVVIASHTGWNGLAAGIDRSAAKAVIEALGILSAAVVALQIAQTIVEEEVIREAHVSGPTRVRRFLSRFLVVVVIALAVEGLVAAFKASNEDPQAMPYAASLVVAVGVLLAGWGVFLRMNRYAEELEPEAMEEAKSEDRKLESS